MKHGDIFDKINFPWFIYPKSPFAGYTSPNYIPELKRLYFELKELQNIDEKILFHLTIGAPMEEIGYDRVNDQGITFQMHQLVPDHIIQVAKLGINVINYVVCPNLITSPLFMILRDDFVKTNKSSYKHKIYPLHIEIFNTMMPTKDMQRNKIHQQHMTNTELKKLTPVKYFDMIEMYKQNDHDLQFVDMFYSRIRETIDHVITNKGYCTCFSFAVFNEDTVNKKFNNFCMFREIMSCYQKERTLICEWVFRYGTYVVYKKSNKNTNTAKNLDFIAISYVPLNMLDNIFNANYLIPLPMTEDTACIDFIYAL